VYVAVLLLLTAIGCEVGATAVIPRTDGFHNAGWSVVVLAGYAASTWLLSIVVKTLPLGVTYAAWAGLGTVIVALIGYVFQGEPMSLLKAGAISLIIAGVVVLNATSVSHG
jgi:small multidrug resistance pump